MPPVYLRQCQRAVNRRSASRQHRVSLGTNALQLTELMSCVGLFANESFVFGIMCVQTRRIPEKLAWPTWNYDSAKMRITDRPSADRGIGHQQVACCSPIALPARRRRPCHLREMRFPQPLTRVAIVVRQDLPDSSR